MFACLSLMLMFQCQVGPKPKPPIPDPKDSTVVCVGHELFASPNDDAISEVIGGKGVDNYGGWLSVSCDSTKITTNFKSRQWEYNVDSVRYDPELAATVYYTYKYRVEIYTMDEDERLWTVCLTELGNENNFILMDLQKRTIEHEK